MTSASVAIFATNELYNNFNNCLMLSQFQDIRKESPSNLQELIDNNYHVIVNISKFNLVEFGDQIILNHDEQIEDYENLSYFEPGRKRTRIYLKPAPHILKTKKFIFRNYKDPVKFINEAMPTGLSGITMPRNDFYAKPFLDVLQRLNEAGLLLKHKGRKMFSFESLFDFNFQNQDDPQVLTWNHLYAGFYVWIAAVVISIIVFICEFSIE